MHQLTKIIGINIIIENPSWKIDYLDLNCKLLNHTFNRFRKNNNRVNYYVFKIKRLTQHTQKNPENNRDQNF